MDEDIVTGERIREDYEFTTWLIQDILEGRTHADSILDPPFGSNCMNWILGHILASRSNALELLEEPPLWDAEILARYRSGSEPIRQGRGARDFALLLDDLEMSRTRLSAALEASSSELLAKVVTTDRGTKSVLEHLEGLHWHETFHIGQLEVLKDFVNHVKDSA